MATRAFTVVNSDMRQIVAQWTGLLNTDDGAPAELADYPDRSIQVQGTPGATPNLRIEGSNDGTNYVALTDPQGNALNVTTSGVIEQVQEITRYIRPRVTGGDGTTNWTVTFFGKRA